MNDPFTGLLMSKDIPIAKIVNDRVQPIREDLLPLYLARTGHFNGWLATRVIDRHRTNSRLLRKTLRLSEYSDEALVLSVHGATIIDTYWLKSEDSPLTYEDVRYQGKLFFQARPGGHSSRFFRSNRFG